jgi:alkanesulfonate monooxygenase SsuD/methylene tetrahydromethanopterin reductase-like flavin-dependent oxidoreductase (luciferase family)
LESRRAPLERRHTLAGRVGDDRRDNRSHLDPALRELWAGGSVTHHGTHFEYGPLSISPVPAEPVPFFVGGDSEAALRRAARIGDGWMGNRVYSEERLDVVLTDLRRYMREYGRAQDDLDIIAPLVVMPDAATYRRFADKGVTGTLIAPWWPATPQEKEEHGDGVELKVSTIERFAEEIISRI